MWKMKVPNYSNKVPPYKIWDMELCTHFLWIGITVFVMDWKFVVGQSLSHVRLFVTPWTAACRDSLSFTISQSLFKLMSIVSMMPSNHLTICRPLLLLPSIFPSIRVFSNESALHPMSVYFVIWPRKPLVRDKQRNESERWSCLFKVSQLVTHAGWCF